MKEMNFFDGSVKTIVKEKVHVQGGSPKTSLPVSDESDQMSFILRRK